MSVNFISSGQQLDINTSTKQLQLDNNDFVKALSSNLSNNTKNTYPIQEKPQQAPKEKQPTQLHSQSSAEPKTNTTTNETVPRENTKRDSSDQPAKLVEQSAMMEEPMENENLMLSGSLIIDLEIATPSLELLVGISQQAEVDVVVNGDEQIPTNNTPFSSNTSQPHTTESSDVSDSTALPSLELFVSTGNITSSDETNMTSVETEKEIFIPEAIASSEVQQLQPITTLKTQEVAKEMLDISGIPIEANPTPKVATGSDDMSEPQLQQNLNENSTAAMDKQAIEQQVAQANPGPQITEQAAVISAQAGNVSDKKAESRAIEPKTQINPSSIVESVKVEPIQNLGNMNPGMSFGSSDESIDIEFQPTSQDLGEIPHFDVAAKPLPTQAMDADLQADLQTAATEDMNSISNQLKSAVQNIGAVNGKRITITLAPESLGRVEVELTIKAGNITAIEIKTVKPETLHMLEKNSQMLHDALKEVTSGSDASLSFNLKEGNHDGSQQQQNAKQANIPLFDINNIEQNDDVKVTPRSTTQGDIYNVDGPNSTVNMKL